METKTSTFTHTVKSTKTGKTHHFVGLGWIDFKRDLVCGRWSETDSSFSANRADLLKTKTLDEALKIINIV